MILKHQHFDLLKKVVLERVVFRPPFKVNASMHNEACFLYAVNGESSLYSPLEKDGLASGKGVVMKCGNYINSWFNNSSEEPNEAVAVHFYPEILKLVYEEKLPTFLMEERTGISAAIEPVKVNEMIQKYVESLLFYFENPSLINDELIVLKVKELILLLVNTDDSNRIRTILRDMFNPVDYSFKEIIQSNIYEDLSVDDLAVLSSMSGSTFKRKFKEIYNDTPARYIRLKRLEKAAELLVIGKNRISDICFECGFSDISHFSKLFAAQYGKTPTAYRESGN